MYLVPLQQLADNQYTIVIQTYSLSRQLASAKDNFTAKSLGLLANYRKRQQLVSVMQSLHTIKTLVSY